MILSPEHLRIEFVLLEESLIFFALPSAIAQWTVPLKVLCNDLRGDYTRTYRRWHGNPDGESKVLHCVTRTGRPDRISLNAKSR